MKECIEVKEIGVCKVDIDKAVRKFTLLHRIFQYRDNFYLLEYTPKCKRKLRVSISEKDAMELIKRLGLKPFKNDFFVNAVIYVPTT